MARRQVKKAAAVDRAARNIEWCEKYLRLPEGKFVGQTFKMAEFMREDFRAIYNNPQGTRRAIITRGRKNSKALALDTPVPTPQGWRTIADIEPGDQVYGADGNAVRVLMVSEIFPNKPCYAVEFSDGSSIVASEDHLWTTRYKSKLTTVTTDQIARTLRVDRPDGTLEHRHKVSCAPAIQGMPLQLPIPPYLLGVWLGNGHAAGARISIGSQDLACIVAEIDAEVSTSIGLGNVCVSEEDRGCHAVSVTMNKPGVRPGTLGWHLRELRLIQNKHIPQCYLDAGLAQRWALLQGLMDTDGTVARHAGRTTPRCSFSNSNYCLAYDVWRLARSLGLKATINSRVAKIYERTIGKTWNVTFPASIKDQVFRLARKQSLLPQYLSKRSNTLTITSCQRVEAVPTKCLMVDARDSLFLVGHGCIPTHNTTECAFILLLHLCGPEHRKNSQLFSIAQSRDQAAILFNLAAKMVRLSPVLREAINVRDTAKELLCIELGTKYKALSAEVSTAFGLSPVLTIVDEAGQIRGPRSSLYEAMETATAAQENPLTVIISTQAATDGDLLSILIDDARAGADPRVVLRMNTAPPDLDPFSEEAIRAANPAFDVFMNQQEVLAMAADAKRMPSRQPEFENLVLNRRIETTSPFISQTVWRECGAPPRPLDGLAVYGGLDLSAVDDLTALVLIGRHNGVWSVHPTFWLPAEGLRERSRTDRVPYDVWARDGHIEIAPGRSVDYEYVARWLRVLFQERKLDIRKIGFDPWKFGALKQWLIKVGFNEHDIDKHFVEVGQGYKSMTPALRTFEGELLNGRVAHGNNPVLTMCVNNAVVQIDPAGNRKLDKSKSIRRIDGAVALAMAFGVADFDAEEREPAYQAFVL